MTLTFPTSPTNGQTATINGTTYTYTSVKNAWAPSAAGVDLSSVSQDILADADSSRSLGSSTNKWKNLHASNITSGDHLPLTDSSHDLGSPTNKWKALYLSSNTLFLGDSGSISAGAGGEITMPSMKIGSGANTVKIGVSASGEFETRKVTGGVVKAAKPSGTNAVQTFSGLASLVDNSAGDTVLVKDTKKVYMYDGTGWYLVATMVNDPPGAITGVDAAISLATDGTATTVTAVSTDPEGFPLTWSYAVTTGSLGTTATVTQADNVFTITPSSTESDAGTFGITFNVTDGVNASVSTASAFTLAFSLPTIANTVRYAAIQSTAPTDTDTNSLRSIASSETKWAVTTGTSVHVSTSTNSNWLDVYNVSDNSLAYSVNLAIPNAYYYGTQLDICDDYIIVADMSNSNGGTTAPPSYGQRGWIGKYNITTGAFITGKTWTTINGSSSTRGFLGDQVKIKPDGTRIYVTAPRAGFGTSAVGSVYVFDASLSIIATITSPNSNDYWGSGGARNSSLTCTDSYWALGHKSATAANVGNVKIYDASNNTLFRTLVHPDGNGTYGFGYSAVMVGDYIAVGSPQGNLASNSIADGMVYIYKVSTGVLMSQIDVPTGFTKYMFGYQMAMTESTLCVGSYTVNTGEQYAAYDITGISTGNGSLLSGVTLTGLGDSTSNNQIGGPMIGNQSNGNIYMGQSNTPFPGAATPSTLAGYGVGWVTVLE